MHCLPREIVKRYLTGVQSAFIICVNPWFIKELRVCKVLYNCRETFTDVMSALQIHLFMQNKANFRKVKLNVNNVLTKDYDQMDTWSIRKTKPIQSQFKPNQSQFIVSYIVLFSNRFLRYNDESVMKNILLRYKKHGNTE